MPLKLYSNLGDEPLEGLIIATYIPRDLFTESKNYSNQTQSKNNLENLVITFIKKIQNRYKSGLKKENNKTQFLFVYTNSKKDENKSNILSLTGRVLPDVLFIEPGRQRVFLPTLDIGFTYPRIEQVISMLDKLNKYFILIAKENSVEPFFKKIEIKTQEIVDGNQALFLIYKEIKEFTIAIKDGDSVRKNTYILSLH